jgi:hypothetical protein
MTGTNIHKFWSQIKQALIFLRYNLFEDNYDKQKNTLHGIYS